MGGWKIGQLKSSCSSIQGKVRSKHGWAGPWNSRSLWTLPTNIGYLHASDGLWEHAGESEQIQPQIIPAFCECTNLINWKIRRYSRFFFIHFLFEIHGGEMRDFESAFHRFYSLTNIQCLEWWAIIVRIIIFFSWERLRRIKSLTCPL